jgi:hypothetical protein
MDGDGIPNNDELGAVLFIGSGHRVPLSAAAQASLERLRRYVNAELNVNFELFGHRETKFPAGTSCPGPLLMQHVVANRFVKEDNELAILSDEQQETLVQFLDNLSDLGSNVNFVDYLIPDMRKNIVTMDELNDAIAEVGVGATVDEVLEALAEILSSKQTP